MIKKKRRDSCKLFYRKKNKNTELDTHTQTTVQNNIIKKLGRVLDIFEANEKKMKR